MPYQRTLFTLYFFTAFFFYELKAQTKIGDNPSSINSAVILELESKKKGFLMPRMNSNQMNSIVTPPVGLQVFNTDSSCVCFYSNSGWKSLCASKSDTNAWSLSGNSTTTSNQFLGTKNNSSLRVRTNNEERMVVDSIGNVGIGTKTPTSNLQINGSFSTTIQEINSNYSLTSLDHIIAVNAQNSDIYVNMPSAIGIKGRQYVFKKVDESDHQIVIKASSGQKIDADILLKISIPWQTKTLISNGKNWLVISNQ